MVTRIVFIVSIVLSGTKGGKLDWGGKYYRNHQTKITIFCYGNIKKN